MIRGFYSGASCLVSQQNNMNTIANNVANINTTGFKPQQAAFSSLLYESLNGGAGSNIQTGHGVKIQKTGVDFTQGDLKSTTMPMDCAIVGDGFFAIENREDGSITYSRDGSFHLGLDDSDTYLVTSAGNYVLDEGGEKIEIEAVTTSKDANGVETQSGGFDSTKIGVYTFSNHYGLEPIGGNQYKATDSSGEGEVVEAPTIKVGYLENSGVQISEEMVKMIEASKGFSFGSKIVQAADEMEKIINQLR